MQAFGAIRSEEILAHATTAQGRHGTIILVW